MHKCVWGLLCVDALCGVLRGLGGREAGRQWDAGVAHAPAQLLAPARARAHTAAHAAQAHAHAAVVQLHAVGLHAEPVEPREQLLLLLAERRVAVAIRRVADADVLPEVHRGRHYRGVHLSPV